MSDQEASDKIESIWVEDARLDVFIEEHKRKCRSLLNTVTNIKKKGRASYTVAKLQSRLDDVNHNWEAAQSRHDCIVRAVGMAQRSTVEYFQSDFMEELEEVVAETREFIYDEIASLTPSTSAVPTVVAPPMPPPTTVIEYPQRLPEIKIPRYSGDPSKWLHFRDLFTSLVINHRKLTDAQRLQYLHSVLEGVALRTIANLEICDDNFEVAWETLEKRFAKKRVIIKSLMAPILRLRTIREDDLESMEQATIDIPQALQALSRWDKTVGKWDLLLVVMITDKFEDSLMRKWEESIRGTEGYPDLEELRDFLETKADALRSMTRHKRSEGRGEKKVESGKDRRSERSRRDKPRLHAHTTEVGSSSAGTHRCKFCSGAHHLEECDAFRKINVRSRFDYAKESQHCLVCLSPDHTVSRCSSEKFCKECRGRHNTLLHFAQAASADRNTGGPSGTRGKRRAKPVNTNAQSKQNADTPTTSKSVTLHCGSTTETLSRSVLLATACIRIYGPNGTSRIARALIDQGSETSFVSSSLANDLRLPRRKTPATVTGLGGGKNTEIKYSVSLDVGPREGHEPKIRSNAFLVPKITAYSPPRVYLPDEKLFNQITLADPDPTADARIDVLLGADVYARILRDGVRRGPENTPIAQETLFGWILSGPCAGAPSKRTVSTLHCNVLESLDQAIRKFWEVEAVPLKPQLTQDEEDCETHYKRTVSRDATGRFVVRIPFKVPSPERMLGDSFHIALSALTRLRRKLDVNEALVQEYGDFLEEYESLGHMTKLLSVDRSRLYIPHRAVIREDSATTKLRVVFNASSSTASGCSLNDTLHVGPKLQRDITAILMNWRIYRYVIVADIEKMFRQIQIAQDDRRFQCILWRNTTNDRLEAFELNTVTYGTACAPYLAMRTLLELAKQDGSKYPLAVPVLERDVYVDDVFMGAADKHKLREIREQVCKLLQGGGFHLRKWVGNTTELLEDIPQSAHSLAVNLDLFDDSELKVLGLRWIPSGDYFYFNLQRFQPAPTPPTKRQLFSEIAKLYDPLGWLSPVVIRAKILMQAQWLEKLHWDQSVSMDTHRTWNSFCADWGKLTQLKIPRWIRVTEDVKSVELHGFCDASLAAYSAVVYLRVAVENDVHVSLLMGKTRVAPIKTLTVPILELNGALLLSELLQHVQSSLKLIVTRVVCWTDSTIALAWLRKHPSTWKLVIANRVSKIQTALPTAEWRHVPTRTNPADLNSRGVDAEELLESTLWISGPPWLKRPETEWPDIPASVETEEEKRAVNVHVASQKEEWEFLLRYSTWSRLLHVTAYCIRFYKTLRGERKRGDNAPLNSSELRDATSRIARYLQKTHLHTEYQCLAQRRPIPAGSRLRSLDPFLDEDSIIRVGGRLKHSVIPWETKHPIILPKHYVATLIIRQSHINTLHGGLQVTLHTVRQRFWILGCRNEVRSVINRCVRCTRWRAEPSAQIMQHLVPERCRPTRPFANCGVDYAGPYRVRDSAGRGKTAHKAYIAVFVCYVTRAVHIELVHDYTTNAFLAAFDRFVSRRGIPVSVLSDNGTNFVGASRELVREFNRCYNSVEMRNRCSELGVVWKFNPPSAPHFGGMQEAGVKSVKHHLKRVLGDFTPTGEEMQTLLCKIEATLNSRPISPLSDSADDYAVLTPGHFLIGGPLNALPRESVETEKLSRLSRWRAIQKFHEQLWRLWTNDYLLHLQQRYKWQTTKTQLQKGDLVLVQNPILPPNKWEMGRIVNILPDSDGNVRIVEVKTASSTYTRPITRMCKLPVENDQYMYECPKQSRSVE